MKRAWFQDDDGTYYRNINLILAEMKRAQMWPWLWLRYWLLSREWDEAWREGLIRTDRLGWRDRVAQPRPFREAYPNHPVLWQFDDTPSP